MVLCVPVYPDRLRHRLAFLAGPTGGSEEDAFAQQHFDKYTRT